MDLVANIGVNVRTEETIQYMGLLYANMIILGDWVSDIDCLKQAMSRGWIYQEMSFGELDKGAVETMLKNMHVKGQYFMNLTKEANVKRTSIDIQRGYRPMTEELEAKAWRDLFSDAFMCAKMCLAHGYDREYLLNNELVSLENYLEAEKGNWMFKLTKCTGLLLGNGLRWVEDHSYLADYAKGGHGDYADLKTI